MRNKIYVVIKNYRPEWSLVLNETIQVFGNIENNDNDNK